MNDRSRLVGEQTRLDRLTTKVEADARPVLKEYRTRPGWADPFARFAPWLMVAAAAGLAGLWLFPGPATADATEASMVELSISPADQTGAAFVLTSQPPAGATLLGLEDQ